MLQAARHRRILAWAGILAGSGEDGRRVKRREGNTVNNLKSIESIMVQRFSSLGN
jgi:hypothetical protein